MQIEGRQAWSVWRLFRDGYMERQWTRVTRSAKCPICGKPDYCSRSGNLVLCMRVESARLSGCRLGGWLHSLGVDSEPTPTTLPKQPKPNIDWTVLSQSMFTGATAAEERGYLAATLGVSESALVELQVGRGWDDYRSKPYSSWPERDETGRVVGIVRRYRDGGKKTMRHSSHGLYYADGYLRMRLGPVFLPEGGSDTAALLSVGVNVVGRPSNLGGVDQLAALLGRCRNTVVVIGERDEKPESRGQHPSCPSTCTGCLRCWPGLVGAQETAKRLRERLRRRVKYVLPPTKDVRAWLPLREMSPVDFLQAVRGW